MTTATRTRTRKEIQAEIDALTGQEYLVATNQGTFGSSEAVRKVGTGDPMFANRDVYETVGGARRERGPDEADAPGRMRKLNRAALAEDRKRLSELKRELRLRGAK